MMNNKRQLNHPLVDLLRGVAVFFLPISNAATFLIPLEAKVLPNYFFAVTQEMTVLWFIYHVFIELKLWYLLAIIFGISFALSQSRYHAKMNENSAPAISDDEFSARQFRRSMGLMLLGAIHGLIFWCGDILLLYGIVSCILVVVNRYIQHPSALFVMMLMLLIGSYSNSFSAIGDYTLFFESVMPSTNEVTYSPLILASELNFIDNRLQNASLFIDAIASARYSYLWIILSLFLSGMILVKLGYFSIEHTCNKSIGNKESIPVNQEKTHRGLIILISNFRYSLLVTFPMLILVSYWQQAIEWQIKFGAYFYWYCFEILSMLLVFGLFSLVLHYRHRINDGLRYNRCLKFFQTAGKLSLSLYLTQTIVLSLLSFLVIKFSPIDFKEFLIIYSQLIYWALGGCTLMITAILVLIWPANRKGPIEVLMQWYLKKA